MHRTSQSAIKHHFIVIMTLWVFYSSALCLWFEKWFISPVNKKQNHNTSPFLWTVNWLTHYLSSLQPINLTVKCFRSRKLVVFLRISYLINPFLFLLYCAIHLSNPSQNTNSWEENSARCSLSQCGEKNLCAQCFLTEVFGHSELKLRHSCSQQAQFQSQNAAEPHLIPHSLPHQRPEPS